MLGYLMKSMVADGEDSAFLACGGENYQNGCHNDEPLYDCRVFETDGYDYGTLVEQEDRDDTDNIEDATRQVQITNLEPKVRLNLIPVGDKRGEGQVAEKEKASHDTKEYDDDETDDEDKDDDEDGSSLSTEVGYVILEPKVTLVRSMKAASLDESVDRPRKAPEKESMKTIIQKRIAAFQGRQRKLEEKRRQEQRNQRQKLAQQLLTCIQKAKAKCEGRIGSGLYEA